MNYAEAVFRYLGSADATDAEFTMSARQAASMTREREGVGMPAFPLNMSNDAFWEAYKKNVWWNLLLKDIVFGMYVVGKRLTNIL